MALLASPSMTETPLGDRVRRARRITVGPRRHRRARLRRACRWRWRSPRPASTSPASTSRASACRRSPRAAPTWSTCPPSATRRSTAGATPRRTTPRVAALDALTICVPTPLSKTRTPDLSYVVSAAESVAEQLSPGQLVILQSTTYPGTTEQVIRPILERAGAVVGQDFFLGYAPERVDPGNKEWDVHTTPKLVAGVTDECLRRTKLLYETIVRDGRAGLEPDGGRDGEAAREHLPRGQHRAGQRAGADVRQARHLGRGR